MMKSKLLFIAVLCTSSIVFGQVDRSQLPAPAEPKEIKIGEYESFTLKNGLQVFVIENHKLPRVTFRLQLDREPIVEGDKAGYTTMVGDLMRRGTSSRSKEQLDEEVDFIGASLFAGSTYVYASGLSKYTEKIFELMTDVMLNPTFPAEELEKIRTQTLSQLATEKDEPDAISNNLKTRVVYGDHPYGELVTEESVSNIQAEDIKEYHSYYYRPNIAYLAVVGDITPKEAQQLVKKYLKSWEAGEVEKPTYPTPVGPSANSVALVNRPASVQSVISVTYPVSLQSYSDDVIAARIMNTVLGSGFASRLNQNLREDKGYTYGAGSSLSSDDLIGQFSAGASVRNVVTDSAINEILYEMERMRTEPVPDAELELAKNTIAGRFGRSLENPQTVASFALNTAINDLPEDYYSGYLKRVESVTGEDVMGMANKYLKPENAYITIVGKAQEISGSLASFGEINYFDTYGEPTEKPKIEMPEGLTAQMVMDKYLEAVGGKEKLSAVNSMQLVMSADYMGNTMEFVKSHDKPKFNLQIKVMGNVMSDQRFDGEKGQAMQGGQKIPLNEQQLMALRLESAPFPELEFEELGVKMDLTGADELDGMAVYLVEVTNPNETSYTLYYSVESGLLLRKSSTQDMGGQTVTFNTDFSDYQLVDGIKVPYVIKIPLGPGVTAEAKVQSVVFNSEMDASLFKVE